MACGAWTTRPGNDFGDAPDGATTRSATAMGAPTVPSVPGGAAGGCSRRGCSGLAGVSRVPGCVTAFCSLYRRSRRAPGLSHLRYRPHGSGAVGGRGARPPRREGKFLPRQRAHPRRRHESGRPLGTVVAGAGPRRPSLRLPYVGPRRLAGRHARRVPNPSYPRACGGSSAGAGCARAVPRAGTTFRALANPHRKTSGPHLACSRGAHLTGAAGRGRGLRLAPCALDGCRLPRRRALERALPQRHAAAPGA